MQLFTCVDQPIQDYRTLHACMKPWLSIGFKLHDGRDLFTIEVATFYNIGMKVLVENKMS